MDMTTLWVFNRETWKFVLDHLSFESFGHDITDNDWLRGTRPNIGYVPTNTMWVIYRTRKSNVIEMSDNSILIISRDELFWKTQNFFGHIHDHAIDIRSVYFEYTSRATDLTSIKSCIGRGRPSSKMIDLLSDILWNAIGFAISGNVCSSKPSSCTR